MTPDARPTLPSPATPRPATPAADHARFRPWSSWLGHRTRSPRTGGAGAALDHLVGGVRRFQRHTAPLVRQELARLAREGQAPSQLFVGCADSRMVTSMITSSGPGDLFTVRNVGNLVPPPQGCGTPGEPGDDSVGAAVEYAVEVLRVRSVTVCGHSGCGAMQGLLRGAHRPSGETTPLGRWLRNGGASLARAQREPARFADRPADELERLCLSNVVQQLENLAAHPAVRSRTADGGPDGLELVGMYFDIAAAQAYLLDPASGVFRPVCAEEAGSAA
ncbi:carbonic anhydrase [Streptacidiphilus sp. ASG 303]|uniref:carbonic anhydrase n=1 Tax=Streptacidiphilus sp. ASG 303 TaxID=2896847 RepID=UPI0035B38004